MELQAILHRLSTYEINKHNGINEASLKVSKFKKQKNEGTLFLICPILDP